jgi:hypothetical protein
LALFSPYYSGGCFSALRTRADALSVVLVPTITMEPLSLETGKGETATHAPGKLIQLRALQLTVFLVLPSVRDLNNCRG